MSKHNPITWTVAGAVWIAVPIACFAGIAAHAATPTVYLQDSTIVGSGGTLTITRLPLFNGSRTVYDDVTIPFSVGPTGVLTVDTPSITTSRPLITSHFLPGTYTAIGGAKDATITVAGPNAGQNGTTVWSAAAVKPDGSTQVVSANWTAGPLSDNPPAAAYIKQYGILPIRTRAMDSVRMPTGTTS